jgi:hypothetical protein
MGLCFRFQSLPESSSLYRGLMIDRRMALLFARLFLDGCGPLARRTLAMDDLSDVLDNLVEFSGAFGSRAQAEETARGLFQSIGRAISKHPGLEERQVFLEKSHWRIRNRLLEVVRLGSRRAKSDAKLMDRVMYGRHYDFSDPTPLLPLVMPASADRRGREQDGPLSVLSSSDVREGAAFLGENPPEAVCPGPYALDREDYSRLRGLFLEAAERDEAVIIGSDA